VDFNHHSTRQGRSIHQTQVDMSVDKTGHHRTTKRRDTGLMHRLPPECHRTELTGNLLEDSRSKAMANPQIINGEPHGYLPISVRTA
jgi:hypothetical protein